MTARRRLPNRRASETFAFECNALRYVASISRYPDGTLAEIFLSNAKAGSHSDAAAKDSAVVCSIALQYGVPLDAIRHALLRDARGNISQRRNRNVVIPRHVGMYLCKRLTLCSFPEIGRRFGGRDHTTGYSGTYCKTHVIRHPILSGLVGKTICGPWGRASYISASAERSSNRHFQTNPHACRFVFQKCVSIEEVQ